MQGWCRCVQGGDGGDRGRRKREGKLVSSSSH